MATFDYLHLLDQIRSISSEGLKYAANSYDLERYQRLNLLAQENYSDVLEIDLSNVKEQFKKEFGIITPKVGVDAAIMNEFEEVLVFRRNDDQKWCLPGGWINIGENPAESAVRAVKEETGIDSKPLGYLGISCKGPLTQPQLHDQINIIVMMELVTKNSKVVLSHEHSAYNWVNPSTKVKWHPGHDKQVETIFKYIDKDSKKFLSVK